MRAGPGDGPFFLSCRTAGKLLALQRKVTSYTSPYVGHFDAPFSQLLERCFAMAGLGSGVVVSGVADLPCGILQKAFTANPPQGPSAAPGGQGIANLVEGKAFDGVRWTTAPIFAGPELL